MRRVRVTGLDHLVLLSSDPSATVAWYGDVLGLTPERLEAYEAGEVFFPSVRVDATTIIDVMPGERDGRNVDHLCLVVEGVDLDELAASGAVDVVSGPSELWGAQGMGMGLYVTDPDGTVVELRTYPRAEDDDGSA